MGTLYWWFTIRQEIYKYTQRDMRKVSFINMKGGVGKTTLSTNVAHCLATRENCKVLVVDIDRKSPLARMAVPI